MGCYGQIIFLLMNSTISGRIWGSALQEVIENNPCAYVLGTSATPIRPEGMIDTVDLYFEGNLFYELTLSQLVLHILPVPVLVQSVYGLDNELDRLQRKLERSGCSKGRKKRYRRNWIWHVWISKRLWGHRESSGSSCCRRAYASCWYSVAIYTDLKQMVPEVCGWLMRAGRAITPFEIHHAQGERQNGRILDAFEKKQTGCTYCFPSTC